MATCWICQNSLYEEHGIEFYNSVRSVPTSDWFWKQRFANKYSNLHEKDQSGSLLEKIIREEMEYFRGGGYVCDECHTQIMVDFELLGKDRYIKVKDDHIWNEIVSLATGRAWEHLYGQWPKGVKKTDSKPSNHHQ